MYRECTTHTYTQQPADRIATHLDNRNTYSMQPSSKYHLTAVTTGAGHSPKPEGGPVKPLCSHESWGAVLRNLTRLEHHSHAPSNSLLRPPAAWPCRELNHLHQGVLFPHVHDYTPWPPMALVLLSPTTLCTRNHRPRTCTRKQRPRTSTRNHTARTCTRKHTTRTCTRNHRPRTYTSNHTPKTRTCNQGPILANTDQGPLLANTDQGHVLAITDQGSKQLILRTPGQQERLRLILGRHRPRTCIRTTNQGPLLPY